MARRRTKRRTHLATKIKPNSISTSIKSSETPKSMVIRIGAGDVGPSVSQLVKDVRQMMEPETAARLKERRANRLKDYIAMSGPLGVTHLMLFSRSESGNTNLRIAITPRGPTLHFNVEKYSLCKDVKRVMRHPRGKGKEYITAPLLVMNNFTSPPGETNSEPKVPKHLESLVTTVFQSLFKPIIPQSTPLSSIKRVMLLDREQTSTNNKTYILNLRHYAITTRVTGLSRPIKRINAAEKLINSRKSGYQGKRNPLNLNKMTDVAEYLIDDDNDGNITDFTSGSEIDTEAEVEVVKTRTKILSKRQKEQKLKSAKNFNNSVEKRAVKLVELGPRMRLRLIKVEEGVCDGKIMWHEYIQKSKEEVKALDSKWEQKRKEREERKKIQRENIERKKKLVNGNADKTESEMDVDTEGWNSDNFFNDEDLIEQAVDDRDE